MNIPTIRERLQSSWIVWICRLIIGCTFILSGWSKAIDPWGFVYKIDDYLTVWQISQPHELVVCGAIALSSLEFIIGVCAITGMLRRLAIYGAAAIMAFMLPLTIWIAIANPVADCGCFGDLLIVSNGMTLVKNIVIAIAITVLLLGDNRKAPSLFTPSVQWLAITISAFYIVAIAVIGYNIQPLVDFRPYPVGTNLAMLMAEEDTDDDTENIRFIYSRVGQEAEFDISDLPDSTWTYVRRLEPATIAPVRAGGSFAIFDEDGEDVSSYVIDSVGTQLLVVIPDPGLHYLHRSRMVNELASMVESSGGSVIGLVGAPTDVINYWADLALPTFDLYSADDTQLKTLVRGDAALVMLDKGRIVWKRTVESLPADFSETHTDLSSLLSVSSVDDPSRILQLSGLYLALMLLCSTLNVAPRIRRYFRHRAQNKASTRAKEESGGKTGQ